MRCVANILAFIVALTSFGCSGDSVTTPPPTQVPVSSVTVAGTVWLHDTGGVKPYANVQVNAWVQTAHSGQFNAPISSGPDGRYSFTVLTGALVRVYIISYSRDTYQPCVTAIAATDNTNLDVHAIVDPAQLGAHLPSELLNDTPTLSGTVFETTALGRQPVPDVRLQLDMFFGLGDGSAQTVTDSDGRYVLCGLGGAAIFSRSPYIYASKSGYQTADVGTVQLNGNTILDIELQR